MAENFSKEERAAMKERAREAKLHLDKAANEADVLAKIAEMGEHDRVMATRIHELVKAANAAFEAKTWYGMPAYAIDGKTICFFQPADKFKSRYATLGFSDSAALDDGEMWPTTFALTELTSAVESQITALVKKAAS